MVYCLLYIPVSMVLTGLTLITVLLHSGSRDTNLPSVQFHSEGTLQMIISGWHWGRDPIFLIQVSQDGELFQPLELYSADIFKFPTNHWWHWGKKLCPVVVEVSQYRAFCVGKVPPGWWSWNDHSTVTLGKRLCTFIVQVSHVTEIFESVEFCIDDSPKMVIPWAIGDDTLHIHCSCLLEDSSSSECSYT